MIPPAYIDLMNRDIDGVLDRDDAQRLADYLAGNEVARVHYQELREAVAALEKVPLLNPPAGLRSRILGAVARLDRPPHHLARRWSPGPLLRARLGYGYAFAAGFAVALLAFSAFRGPSAPSGDLRGDLQGAILGEVAAGRGAEVAPVVIAAAGITGSVRAFTAGDHVLIRLGLASDRPVKVRFEYDERMSCASYSADNPVTCDLTISGKQVELNHTGSGDYDIILKHAEQILPAIRVQVLENRSVLFAETIALASP